VDSENRQPVRKLEIRAQDGRVLESRDITAIIPEI